MGTEAARRVLHDDDASMSKRHAARQTVKAAPPVVAARLLAVAPGPSAVLFGCLSVFLAVVAVVSFASYVSAAGSLARLAEFTSLADVGEGPWPILVVGFAAGLTCLLLLLRIPAAVARQKLVKAGRPAAEAIWRLGWYCCRWAIVYFQPGQAPPGITPAQPLTPAQFQHIVWTAGRYRK